MTESSTAPVLLWFRRDLRLADHPALTAAVATGRPIVPVYLLDGDDPGGRPLGGAARWWLHESLAALGHALEARGSALILRRGPPGEALVALARETGADTVYWSRTVGVDEAALAARLEDQGVAARRFGGCLLFDPDAVRTQQGRPFQVFTPFWNRVLALDPPPRPEPAPSHIPAPYDWPAGDALEDWALQPTQPDWAGGLRATWAPGEEAANAVLDGFLDGPIDCYAEARDALGVDGTSRLSPYLRFGEVGPRTLWHAVRDRPNDPSAEVFLRELGWREFCHHLLHEHPAMAETPLKESFAAFPWRDDPAGLEAWQTGRTGYPVVDAAMRKLWRTGWMHNRARMIVGSFLVKDLRIDWREGERWFWDTLVDACPANNPCSWQWIAGCGADAAPYFRIFNPVLQGEKFDTTGRYVRRWVPELARLPDRVLHKPWSASAPILREAGVQFGETYPGRIVDHGEARDAALKALATITDRVSG
ncbi:deoxyribodipyrimidine photo-lyase [Roseospira marina]|uniref:Deoxyribodipyrimidine photo-lyase n=1 Tax=Roseospira marina TaxID=140057 RepID=A0A5M6I6I9_9PROT|nr:deoxyribodipyrimidine photo-lyase [Roseospira marina]KAA5603861.1 deoxyribodipyrimidine photo-lyase [Roseospira marina]MBB4313725.1 deoxyribodipyrimidine photo-lyase [Roseospira marina]MBB5086887.1 deoxyribodipyrimidine photo-lyase [Roseospira marina]